MQNKSILGIFIGGMLVGGAMGFGTGQKVGKTSKPSEHSGPQTCSIDGGSSAPTQLVTIEGQNFTEDDLPGELKSAFYDTKHESHEKMAAQLKQFAAQVILAKQKDPKVDLNKMPPLQELLPKTEVSEAQLKQFYEENKARIPQGTTYEQVKPELQRYLQSQQASAGLQTQLAQFEKEGRFKIHIAEPAAPFVKLELAEQPTRGKADAKISLVEVSDYLCPHCQRAQGEVEEILKKHGDDIKFTQVNFALRPQELSGTLVRGAFCARKQSDDLFWKWHTAAFKPENTANKDEKAVVSALVKIVGLNDADFQKCLGSDEAKNFLEQTSEKMRGYGVSGTPTFFINGQRLGHGSVQVAVEAALQKK